MKQRLETIESYNLEMEKQKHEQQKERLEFKSTYFSSNLTQGAKLFEP